jgi:hypothetical protein
MKRRRHLASFRLSAVALVAAAALMLTAPAVADRASSASSSGSMRYLIITSHTPEKCLADLDAVMASKPEMLDRIEWGCKGGDHTGYVIVEAGNEQAARQMLPTPMQATARVIKLNRFSAQDIRSFHQTMK